MKLAAQISAGELLDKISILEIKSEKISDPSKLVDITKEKDILLKEADKLVAKIGWLKKLKNINLKLWETEDCIRDKERRTEFDQEFTNLARTVYFTNDERFSVKNEINQYYNSYIVEQKSYIKYN